MGAIAFPLFPRLSEPRGYMEANFLKSPTLRSALIDVRRSHLPAFHKDVVSQILRGKHYCQIADHWDRSSTGIKYIFRRSLSDLSRESGYRRWIRICSKGHIRQWRKSPYSVDR